MERANTDLMLQNLCIMEENERLRRMARELDQENKKMLADLRMKQQQQQQQQQQMATSSRTAAQMAPGGASSGATARASKSGKKQPK
jgi:vacuolar-type H+-ATPase subunit E/Vma4